MSEIIEIHNLLAAGNFSEAQEKIAIISADFPANGAVLTALSLQLQGKTAPALEAFMAAMTICQAKKRQTWVAAAHIGIATCQYALGNEPAARAAILSADSILNSLPRSEKVLLTDAIGRLNMLKGQLYAAQDMHEAAVRHFQLSEKSASISGYAIAATEAIIAIADVYAGLEMHDAALRHHHEAAIRLEQLEQPHGAAVQYKKMGEIFTAMRHGRRSYEAFEKSLALFKTEGSESEVAEALALFNASK